MLWCVADCPRAQTADVAYISKQQLAAGATLDRCAGVVVFVGDCVRQDDAALAEHVADAAGREGVVAGFVVEHRGARDYTGFCKAQHVLPLFARPPAVVEVLVTDTAAADVLATFFRGLAAKAGKEAPATAVLKPVAGSQRAAFVFETCVRPRLDDCTAESVRRIAAQHGIPEGAWDIDGIAARAARREEQRRREGANRALAAYMHAQRQIRAFDATGVFPADADWDAFPGSFGQVASHVGAAHWAAVAAAYAANSEERAAADRAVRAFLRDVWRAWAQIPADMPPAAVVAAFRARLDAAHHRWVDFAAMEREVAEAVAAGRAQVCISYPTQGHESSTPRWLRTAVTVVASVCVGMGCSAIVGSMFSSAAATAGTALCKGALIGAMTTATMAAATGTPLTLESVLTGAASGGLAGTGAFAVGEAAMSAGQRIVAEGVVGATVAAASGRNPLHGAVYSMVGEATASHVSDCPAVAGAASAVSAAVCGDAPADAFVHGATVAACNHVLHKGVNVSPGQCGVEFDGRGEPVRAMPGLDDPKDCLVAKKRLNNEIERTRNLERLRAGRPQSVDLRRAHAAQKVHEAAALERVGKQCPAKAERLITYDPNPVRHEPKGVLTPIAAVAWNDLKHKLFGVPGRPVIRDEGGFDPTQTRFAIFADDSAVCVSAKTQFNFAERYNELRTDHYSTADVDKVLARCGGMRPGPAVEVVPAVVPRGVLASHLRKLGISQQDILVPLIEGWDQAPVGPGGCKAPPWC